MATVRTQLIAQVLLHFEHQPALAALHFQRIIDFGQLVRRELDIHHTTANRNDFASDTAMTILRHF